MPQSDRAAAAAITRLLKVKSSPVKGSSSGGVKRLGGSDPTTPRGALTGRIIPQTKRDRGDEAAKTLGASPSKKLRTDDSNRSPRSVEKQQFEPSSLTRLFSALDQEIRRSSQQRRDAECQILAVDRDKDGNFKVELQDDKAMLSSLNKTGLLAKLTPELIATIVGCASGMVRAHWVWTPEEKADLELCRDKGDPDERQRMFDGLWRRHRASGAKCRALPPKPTTIHDVARIDVAVLFNCVDEMLAFRSLRTRNGGVQLDEVEIHTRKKTGRELTRQLLGNMIALSQGMLVAQWYFPDLHQPPKILLRQRLRGDDQGPVGLVERVAKFKKAIKEVPVGDAFPFEELPKEPLAKTSPW